MEIQETGKLIVDGGEAHQPDRAYTLGGGAGGIIQIIAPAGSLAADTLSMSYGQNSGCFVPATNGHLLVKGKYTALSKLCPRACGCQLSQWPLLLN